MTTTHIRILAAGLLLAGLAVLQPARAAESYDACAGFIDSLPATISQQGVWCLRKDLSTNISSGNAITINVNNVTIDCNGFKLGGLAAGNGSHAHGVYAYNRQNVTVRNCSIRGFNTGIYLSSGAGHLIEDNRLDNNLHTGIAVFDGVNSRVRRNAVYDTGGSPGSATAYGIVARGDIVDNVISGLFADKANDGIAGILVLGADSQVRDNAVSGFDAAAVQGGFVYTVIGIQLRAPRTRVSGNHLANGSTGALISYGVYVFEGPAHCLDNTAIGFTTAIHAECTAP